MFVIVFRRPSFGLLLYLYSRFALQAFFKKQDPSPAPRPPSSPRPPRDPRFQRVTAATGRSPGRPRPGRTPWTAAAGAIGEHRSGIYGEALVTGPANPGLRPG